MASPDNAQGKEVVGVFGDASSFQEAIDELLTSGFDRAEISLLAGEEAVVEKLGHKYKKIEEIEDNDEAPRADYVDAESLGEAKGALIGGLFYIGAFAAAGAILASGGALATILAARRREAAASSSELCSEISLPITMRNISKNSSTMAVSCYGCARGTR